MIDIEPYLHKLEVLKEYMAWAIDSRSSFGWSATAEEIIGVYKKTGFLICPFDKITQIFPFEEYYQSKHPQ